MLDTPASVVAPATAHFLDIISRLNRAHTPHSIVRTLADRQVVSSLSFERCGLMLHAHNAGESENQWSVIWAMPGSEETSTEALDFESSPFASLSGDAAPMILDETMLRSTPLEMFRGMETALVMPLSTGGACFGALCFASNDSEAYSMSDARNIRWLSDAVAMSAQAALLREKLESAAEARRELDNLKGGFANVLLRDLRLPLTSVLGLLELFESKLQAREPFDTEDRQLLTGTIEQGNRMRHLLDDLLEIARHQEKPLALETAEAEAAQLIEETLEPLRGAAALRGIELTLRLADDTPRLRVDARQIRRALCHLLSVALTASPDGGQVTIEVHGLTGTRVGEVGRRLVIFNVIDSGGGIPVEEVPYVFDAFWHASNPQRSRGRGIGLAIAKRIAAAHGGSVAVRSVPGASTTYSLVIPAAIQRPTLAGDAPHILIVDDAPELLLLLGKLVTRMGYRVSTASGVVHALKILREQPVDLLITDWAMPEANGGDLIAKLKGDQRWRNLPAVVLTGHDTDTERREAEKAGCDRFLVKPVMRDELQVVINELLPQAKTVDGR